MSTPACNFCNPCVNLGFSACPCGLTCTVIGSLPKPDYVSMPDWFSTLRKTGLRTDYQAHEANTFFEKMQGDAARRQLEDEFARATKELEDFQADCGIDIVTDGEVRRENYIYGLLRSTPGVSFGELIERVMRNGAYKQASPVVVNKIGKITGIDALCKEWQLSQAASAKAVKYTLPGPLTVAGTICATKETGGTYYEAEQSFCEDYAAALNELVRALAAAGCAHIQIDEPVFARAPEKALAFGIACLEKCFAGLPEGVTRTTHVCCGYPDKLDETDYPKADPEAYFKIASALDASPLIDCVSLEDAWRNNDLTLLDLFQSTTVQLGVVSSNSSKVETVEQIAGRVREALRHVPMERLQLSPDCGLAMLPMPLIEAKLRNMSTAAALVRGEVLAARAAARFANRGDSSLQAQGSDIRIVEAEKVGITV